MKRLALIALSSITLIIGCRKIEVDDNGTNNGNGNNSNNGNGNGNGGGNGNNGNHGNGNNGNSCKRRLFQ